MRFDFKQKFASDAEREAAERAAELKATELGLTRDDWEEFNDKAQAVDKAARLAAFDGWQSMPDDYELNAYFD